MNVSRWLTSRLALALGIALVGAWIARVPIQVAAQTAQPVAPEGTLVAQVLDLLNRGEKDQARKTVSANAAELSVELNKILDEIDRDFDEMSRQKALSDALDKMFESLMTRLADDEKILDVYSEITGDQKTLRRFQAKRLRIEGARHTTRADMHWDRLEYEKAYAEYDAGIKVLREAIPIARVVEDQKLVGSCLNNIAYAEINSGNHPEGLTNFTEALKLADKREDDVYRALYNLNLATYYLTTGNPQDSIPYSKEARALAAKTGRKTWEANALLSLGSAELMMNHPEQAEDVLRQALAKAEEANDRRSKGRALYNLALLSGGLKRPSDAAALMRDAMQWYSDNLDVYSEPERTVLRYHGLGFLASTYSAMNEPQKSRDAREQMIELRARDSKKLDAYLTDPHLNFQNWQAFKRRNPK